LLTSFISYTIPTDEGDLSEGHRLHNWIWYSNLPPDSPTMKELFTDTQGKLHQGTVPRGLIKAEAWEMQKKVADEVLPEGIAAIVKGTPSPFVTKVYDVTSPQATFFDGKLFLVGDAQTTLRPNIGMSTTHAAFDCNELEKVIEGALTPAQWEKSVLRWVAAKRRFAEAVSAYGLGSKLSVLWYALCWVGILVGQKIGLA
jgi:2-polyprenyl-6-methoxyphenol hydroxylase-like FAD-dependent oxidoreductase